MKKKKKKSSDLGKPKVIDSNPEEKILKPEKRKKRKIKKEKEN